jgi:hypothetical protein
MSPGQEGGVIRMPLIDPNKNPVGLDRRLEGERDPVRRRMLDEVRFHIAVEAAGEIEPAIQRLAPECEYVLYDHATAPVTISGAAAIRRDFYEALFRMMDVRLEWDIVRCMVDGNAVITEGKQKSAVRGSALLERGIQEADADTLYLQEARHLVIWPFDDQLRLIGETVYFGFSAPPAEMLKRPLKADDFAPFRGKILSPA